MQEKKIGEIIAEAREKAGYSQRQLAKIANISNAELSKIESGEREVPNPKTLRKISKHIKVNYNEMVKQRYSMDNLLLSLRQKEIKSIDDVEYAFLEPNRKL